MSTHTVNLGTEDVLAIAERLVRQVSPILGLPSVTGPDLVTGDITLAWETQLTPGQVTGLTELARAAKTGLSRAERNGMQPDVDLLVTFQGIASPTLVQTVAAVKAQSRILRALLRS